MHYKLWVGKLMIS